MYLLFKDIKEADKNIAINSLINESTPKPAFFFLVNLSTIMATLGLLINNTSVVIGSMLIAPILSPILALAMGVSIADPELIRRSSYTLIKSAFSAIVLSTLTTLIFWKFAVSPSSFREVFNPEIISRTEVSIIYFFIAIVAGLTTAFARMKPELNDALPGTAIAIALVPPLATIGIGLAMWNFSIVSGATTMFLVNALGIVLAALIIFSLMRLHQKRNTIERARKKADEEQRKIEEKHEEEKIEEKIDALKEAIGIEENKKKN